MGWCICILYCILDSSFIMAYIKLPKKRDVRVPTTKKQEYQDIYQDRRWKLLRQAKMRANPVCERCDANNKVSPTEEVHHIIPFEWGKSQYEREELAFDYDNLLSVCVACHKEVHRSLDKHNIKDTLNK